MLLFLGARAQEGAADRDRLLARTGKLRTQMLKDSVPMSIAQLDTLWAQARDAKPPIAIKLLERSLTIADSLDDVARERDVLFALSALYRKSGKASEALNALNAAHYLKDSLAALDLERASASTLERIAEEERKARELAAQQRAVLDAEREAFRQEGDRLRLFLLIAAGGIVVLLALLVWALVRIARLQRKARIPRTPAVVTPEASVPKRNTLRSEPDAGTLPPGFAKAQGDQEGTAAAPAPAVAPVPAPAALDPEAQMLLALFRKRMPERLQALREARAQGDRDKVVRVIASMRPQLAQHDEERFSERCARLIAAGGEVLSPIHGPDIDRLIADVEAALDAGSGGK
ncbi:MAG TPA: hypothetical protein VGE21_15375 [Flavobacteriales bacterium]